MRKTFVILLCIALALAVTACGSKTDDVKDEPAPLPPPPLPPVVEEPVVEEVPPEEAPAEDDVTVIDSSEVFKGEVTGDATVELTNVKCDMTAKKLTFTIENMGEKSWQLNQEVTFPPPMDLGQVKLILNNYEMNGRGKIYYTSDDGTRMFGPNEKFSDNCGSVEVIAPGETATCTIYPIAIVGGDDHEQTSRFLIDTPGGSTMFTFQCGA